jgi:hypothetical protein
MSHYAFNSATISSHKDRPRCLLPLVSALNSCGRNTVIFSTLSFRPKNPFCTPHRAGVCTHLSGPWTECIRRVICIQSRETLVPQIMAQFLSRLSASKCTMWYDSFKSKGCVTAWWWANQTAGQTWYFLHNPACLACWGFACL